MWSVRQIVLLTLAVGLVIGLACSDSDDETPDPTTTPPPDATDIARAENEGGEAPIFWRTEDDFASLRAGEAYKVLLRITNGYDEDTISLVAVRKGDEEEIQLTSNRAEPVGGDLPGSYYPTFLLLPYAGTWELTILAGDDEVTVQFDVAEAAG